MKVLLKYFTQKYDKRSYYEKKKAEYSIVLMLITLFAMTSIMILEGILVSVTPFKLITTAIFIGGFICLAFLVREGYYVPAVNFLILASILRTFIVFNYPTPFQFYVMGVLSMITVSIVYTKFYQVIITDLFFLILYIYRVFISYSLVEDELLHYRAYTESIYSVILLIAVIIMLYFLTQIINKEIKESETLLKQATTDYLTQLYNRGKIIKIYENLIKTHQLIGIIIIDIDHFKRVNDTFGHLVGDEILKEIAKLLHKDNEDVYVSRWGGEEFLILFPYMKSFDLINYCEKLRLRIASNTFTKNQKITISIGASSASFNDSFVDIVRKADTGLYTSKENGRNQTTLI